MSRDEWLSFVTHGTRTGKLATVRANGAPHVAPVWFLVDTDTDTDGHTETDHVVFTTGAETLKGRSLRRDPRFSLCVDTDVPPFAFVVIHGEAELSADLEEMLPWAIRLGARYMGEEKGAEFGRRNAVEGELLVRGRITKVVAQADIAD